MTDLLTQAFALHREGRLAEAEPLYRTLLEKDPKNENAQHLLGVILYQTSREKEALPFLEEATHLNPQAVDYWYNYANALRKAGEPKAAMEAYRQVIQLNPTHAAAYNNLGVFATETGDLDQAIEYYEAALKARPDFVEALDNKGRAHEKKNELNEALACYRTATQKAPSFAEAWNRLGNILRALKRPAEAVEAFQKALSLDGSFVGVLVNLGNALREQGKNPEAMEAYDRAIEIMPTYAEAHYNRALLLQKQRSFAEAQEAYDRTLELEPTNADALLNKGSMYYENRTLDKARAAYLQALELRPDFADARWNLALLQLMEGDYENGWPGFEWRWSKPEMPRPPFPCATWEGEPLEGKSILLCAEQGLGDNLQFIRYAPLLKALGAHTIYYGPKPLTRLFQTVEGLDEVLSDKAPPPPCDYLASLMSLPWLCGTTSLEKIPSKVPYFQVDPARAAFFAAKMPPSPRLKVGLLWAGNPRKEFPGAYEIDKRRSMRLEQFAPLAQVEGVDFYSLQKGELGDQAKTPPEGMRLIDLMGEIEDFADTAALIANLDLVIGVDTSVVHLSGALGKPTWILSRFDGCWRWLMNREDSPWYPSARLFRQEAPGAWGPVVEAVRAALESYPKA